MDEDDKLDGRRGGGDSSGGAYSNPHGGKDGDKDGFAASGGQAEQACHGHGRLGEDETGDNPNAPAEKE